MARRVGTLLPEYATFASACICAHLPFSLRAALAGGLIALDGSTRAAAEPFDAVYGPGSDNPPIPNRRGWPLVNGDKAGWCEARAQDKGVRLALNCNGCYEGRAGRFCEKTKQAFCLRDCTGHGRCDSGFCWCEVGWHGVDCGDRTAAVRSTGPQLAASPRDTTQLYPSLQLSQKLPSRANGSPLRIYVYDMPAEFTTRMLQYRPSGSLGVHRAYDDWNRSRFHAGSLYALGGVPPRLGRSPARLPWPAPRGTPWLTHAAWLVLAGTQWSRRCMSGSSTRRCAPPIRVRPTSSMCPSTRRPCSCGLFQRCPPTPLRLPSEPPAHPPAQPSSRLSVTREPRQNSQPPPSHLPGP